MRPQYVVEDEHGVVHQVRAYENNLQVGVLECLDWYSRVGKATSMDPVAKAQGGGRRCLKGRAVFATITCVRCLATCR